MRLALLVFEFLLGPLRSSILEEAYPRIADSITNSTTANGTEDLMSPSTSTASPNCTFYTVQTSDNCFTITSATNTTWEQLLAWNPNLNVACSNLHDFTSLCVNNQPANQSVATSLTDAVITAPPAP
ncbi:hypothetical protein Plec18167_007210 [Paecilomyces lecythidis]|uniref:LysM domain-containing protein n=1 Tax=Paecilomyces lecythidis TaxID=3004212 RepID=A0ABR3X5R6_9EURO